MRVRVGMVVGVGVCGCVGVCGRLCGRLCGCGWAWMACLMRVLFNKVLVFSS